AGPPSAGAALRERARRLLHEAVPAMPVGALIERDRAAVGTDDRALALRSVEEGELPLGRTIEVDQHRLGPVGLVVLPITVRQLEMLDAPDDVGRLAPILPPRVARVLGRTRIVGVIAFVDPAEQRPGELRRDRESGRGDD